MTVEVENIVYSIIQETISVIICYINVLAYITEIFLQQTKETVVYKLTIDQQLQNQDR